MQGEDSAADARLSANPAKTPEKRARKKQAPRVKNPDETFPSLDDAAEVEKEPVDHLAELEESDFISDEEREKLRSKYLLDRFWLTARGFWRRGSDRLAWVLTIGLLVLILLNLATQYGINIWNRAIFDALEKHDSGRVLYFALAIFPLAAVSVSIGVANVYARMTTQRRWRAWMSKNVLDQWLTNGRYYQLNLVSGDHQNPEGRLTEDLRVSTDAPVDFTVGIVSASLSAITFITVLWTIGGALTVTIAGNEVTIPGFLVIAAVIYAAVASGAMVMVANRFVKVSEVKNQKEAEYRYALTRIRENGESIALLGGEEEERAGIDRSLRRVLRTWRDLCGQHMRATIVSQGSGVIAPIIPIVLCAPKFLEGSMSLGQVMQAASAFAIVQGAFNWLVDNYPRLADWNACARRVASLMVSLDALGKAESGEGVNRIKRGEAQDAAMRLRDFSVTLDDGTAVVDDTEVVIKPGERVLVTGESGTGKSTLVRAISGLWPWGGGQVDIQADSRLILLPQRPYIPSGTLRRAIAYPGAAEDWDIEEITDALKKVGLVHLVDSIEEDAPWDQTLSGGEKQRLTFARVLLHRPDIIVLDEATSALDPRSQDSLMKLLSDEMQGLTIVSVGHRPELEQFHNRKLILERRRGGAKLVSDIKLFPRKPKLIKRWLKRRKRRRNVAA